MQVLRDGVHVEGEAPLGRVERDEPASHGGSHWVRGSLSRAGWFLHDEEGPRQGNLGAISEQSRSNLGAISRKFQGNLEALTG